MTVPTRDQLEVDVLIVGGGPGGPVGGAAARAAAEGEGRRAAVDRGPREGARGRRAPAVGRAARSVDAARADPGLQGARARRSSARCSEDNIYFLTPKKAAPAADHAAAVPEPRQLHHLAQQVHEVAGDAGRSGGHRSLHRLSRPDRAVRWHAGHRRAHRRQRHRPARRAEGQLRAGRRHPRQGHDLRRRRARQSHQGADSHAAARRRRRTRRVCDRPQGDLGGSDGSACARHRDSHARAIRCARRSSAAASSTRCPTAASRSASSSASTTRIRCSIRTPRSSASSCIRSSAAFSTAGR